MIGGRGEVARKGLHVGLSLIAAAIAWWLPHPLGATVLAAATTIALSVELARKTSETFATRFLRRLAPLLRDDEAAGLTGATTLSLGYTVAAAMLPGRAAVGGILFTGVADALAALVGRRWGRHPYPGGKSLEGSLAFLAASFLLGLALPGIGPQTAAIVAVVLTLVEAITVPVDDNLYLPLVGAIVLRAVAGGVGVGIFS